MPIHEKSLIRPENLVTHEHLEIEGVDVLGTAVCSDRRPPLLHLSHFWITGPVSRLTSVVTNTT